MADRSSALEGHYNPGQTGAPGEAGVILQEVRDLVLHQVAAWPETIEPVGSAGAQDAGVKSAPGPLQAEESAKGAMLRIEPLKWWVYGVEASDVDPEAGATLDLSHSRTHIRITGNDAVAMLNRYLPLDLREKSFPVGSVGSTVFHHVGVTLWRSKKGYELFIPRGFALSLWHLLVEGSEQFGLEVLEA